MPADVPITVIGGRGPHGLALHLWMQDRGLSGYRLVDPAPHWLPLYGPDSPMQAVTHLRSPRELDFSFGDPIRAMTTFCDEDGTQPLARVYSLHDVAHSHFNETTTPNERAPRLAFWRYANCVARLSRADEHVLNARVARLEPEQDGWCVHSADGGTFRTAATILATGLTPHLRIPTSWQTWWRHLPEGTREHALSCRYSESNLEGRRIVVVGSSNTGTWEAAIRAAECGAKVTLLSRALNPVEWQLPFPPHWFTREYMKAFMALPDHKRLKLLKKTHVPASALPGTAERAQELGIKVVHYARVQYASPLWGGVQVQYRTAHGEHAGHFDKIIAATGVSPRIKELPMLTDAAREHRAPVIVGGPARYRPHLDEKGRWKRLPPLYPVGAYALARAGLAANSLASATVYLPFIMPSVLEVAGVACPGNVAASV